MKKLIIFLAMLCALPAFAQMGSQTGAFGSVGPGGSGNAASAGVATNGAPGGNLVLTNNLYGVPIYQSISVLYNPTNMFLTGSVDGSAGSYVKVKSSGVNGTSYQSYTNSVSGSAFTLLATNTPLHWFELLSNGIIVATNQWVSISSSTAFPTVPTATNIQFLQLTNSGGAGPYPLVATSTNSITTNGLVYPLVGSGGNYDGSSLTGVQITGNSFSASAATNTLHVSEMRKAMRLPNQILLNPVFDFNNQQFTENGMTNMILFGATINRNRNVWVALDAQWWTSNSLSSSGTFLPNPTNMPNGFNYETSLAHTLGLKFQFHLPADGTSSGTAVTPALTAGSADTNAEIIAGSVAALGGDGLFLDGTSVNQQLYNQQLVTMSAALVRHGNLPLWVTSPDVSSGFSAIISGTAPSLVATNGPLTEFEAVANVLQPSGGNNTPNTNGANTVVGDLMAPTAWPTYTSPGNYIQTAGVDGNEDTNTLKCEINSAALMVTPVQIVRWSYLTNDTTATNICYLTNDYVFGPNGVLNDTLCLPATMVYSNSGVELWNRPLQNGVLLGILNLNNYSTNANIASSNVWQLAGADTYEAINIDPRNNWSSNYVGTGTFKPLVGENTLDDIEFIPAFYATNNIPLIP